ncbi:hypothetical protein [Pseudomonas sp. OHS18]|uniref:hypothetical protein n=1 Tax=Pseudomonas sp. OHS18 TaxID=3399679 RepID=UPI003A8542F8
MRLKTVALTLVAVLFCLKVSGGELEAMQTLSEATTEKLCEITYRGKKEAIVPFTATAYSLSSVEKSEVINLIEMQVANGCSLEAADSEGTSALNVAILKGEPELLDHLLKMGADPMLKIRSKRRWANGLNSYEFAALLYKHESSDRRRGVVRTLDEYQRHNN